MQVNFGTGTRAATVRERSRSRAREAECNSAIRFRPRVQLVGEQGGWFRNGVQLMGERGVGLAGGGYGPVK